MLKIFAYLNLCNSIELLQVQYTWLEPSSTPTLLCVDTFIHVLAYMGLNLQLWNI